MAGIMRMYNLRGGFDGMENEIPLMAFWYTLGYTTRTDLALLINLRLRLDLVGAAVLDWTPRLPIPIHQRAEEIESLQLAVRDVVSDLEHEYPVLYPTVQAFKMMSSVAEVVNKNGNSEDFWRREVEAIRLIGPVTHHLLSIPRLSATAKFDPYASFVGELARLACLMLLSRLKTRFSLNALDMQPLQTKLVNTVAQNSGKLDPKLGGLALWALMTAALVQPVVAREYLLPHILISCSSKGFCTEAAMGFTRSTLWMNELEDNEEWKLAGEIENYSKKL